MSVKVGNIEIGKGHPLALLVGPCQIESEEHALMLAGRIHEICTEIDMPYVYKSSFDKANRSSLKGERGVGMEEGLRILQKVKDAYGCPIVTDIHEVSQCQPVAEVADILQIPAFLCRQTDLLIAAGKTGAAINVKKGQFLAPWDMKNVADKIASTGNNKIMLCERGTSFGYNTLVSDFRSLPIMAETGYPVVFDATHSVQQPGGKGTSSGGDRRFVPVLARAAVAVGCDALFIETHEDPDNAPSDGPNMVPVDELENLICDLSSLRLNYSSLKGDL